MLLKVSAQGLSNIKAKMDHRIYFRFLNLDVALFSDTSDTLQAFETIYQYFKVDVQPAQALECFIIKKHTDLQKPCVIIEITNDKKINSYNRCLFY